jgi:hypothetical protein
MTAIGHDVKFAVSDRGIQLSRMRVPWTRGATSGALLLVLGAWVALVPFVGPYFNFADSAQSAAEATQVSPVADATAPMAAAGAEPIDPLESSPTASPTETSNE